MSAALARGGAETGAELGGVGGSFEGGSLAHLARDTPEVSGTPARGGNAGLLRSEEAARELV